MSTPPNPFKQALAERRQVFGLWMALADPYAAELCATCGFDWLLIDGEHAPNDLRSMLSSLQAVAPYPVAPVVRIPKADDALVKQVLDIGATTLMVPMVESAEQAEALVRAMRYPPQGIRGVGSGIARSGRWSQYPSYLQDANSIVSLIVQLETREAVQRAGEIAAVDGVDGVFIGPADLAASMGLLGQSAYPDVIALIEKGLQDITASGKSPGILCVDEALATRYVDAGARFVAIGTDTGLLVRNATALAQRFRNGQAA